MAKTVQAGNELEHDIQSAFTEWRRWKANGDNRYLNLFAVPNGILKNVAAHRKLVKEGFESGVPDYLLLYPSKSFHGLCLEFKRGKNTLSDNQRIWQKRLENAEYAFVVVRSFEEAKNAVEWYLKDKKWEKE